MGRPPLSASTRTVRSRRVSVPDARCGQESPQHTVRPYLAPRTPLFYDRNRQRSPCPTRSLPSRKSRKTRSPTCLKDAIPPRAKKTGRKKPFSRLWKKPRKNPSAQPPAPICDEHGHARFTTISGTPVRRLYTPADLPEDWSAEKYLGYPGQPPFTRGIHASGYRGKLFTMRQFSGFASPEETNQRYKYLLESGGSGLSVAFDLPTLMGYDSDHPASEGEVGKCGVAIDSLEDMEILFGGIDLEKTTVSMTINSPASVSVGDVPGGRRKTRRGLEENFRHAAERHPEGIHRAEGIHLSAGAVDAPGGGHLRVRLKVHSEVQHHFDQRIPHPRSRLHRAAGTGFHSV